MERHQVNPAPQTAHRRNQGSSLVEVMIVMTIASVLLSLAMTGLSRLFRAQAAETQAAGQAAVWRRLSAGFRHDIHSCTHATLVSPQRLELQSADGLVVWSAEHGLARRAPQNTPRGNSNASVPSDDFRFPDAQITFGVEQPEGSNASLARLLIAQPGATVGQPFHSRVEARVAMLSRFQQPKLTTEDAQ
ncbi:MAG: PulJ/GspJ family protein [Planctomycetota bacterium]|jgi:prepilin-type N-terminal cleavage/methylation domain-containing protein